MNKLQFNAQNFVKVAYFINRCVFIKKGAEWGLRNFSSDDLRGAFIFTDLFVRENNERFKEFADFCYHTADYLDEYDLTEEAAARRIIIMKALALYIKYMLATYPTATEDVMRKRTAPISQTILDNKLAYLKDLKPC